MAVYYNILTNQGLALDAAAKAGGAALDFAQLAVGDGGGVYSDPLPTQIALVNEVWRGAVNRVYVPAANPNWVVIEARIPIADGGFDIREAAIFNAAGQMLGVGKYPLTTKPAVGSGSEKDLYIRMILQVTNAVEVVQTIDPTLVMASQQYVDDHGALPAPHSGHETPAGAQAKIDAAIAALIAASPAALDTLNELAAALGDDPNFATTMTNALAGKETPAGAQAKVDAHGALTAPHSATATPIANRLPKYDASGRLEAIAGIAGNDVVNFGQFQVLLSAAGYQKLPSGLILQWQLGTESNSATDYKLFPLAFPTVCYGAFFQYEASGPLSYSANYGTVIGVVDRTKFLLSINGTWAGGGIGYVFSIGR
jgi:phage-related tail fiber protein